MSDTILLKRRSAGAPGPPATLQSGEPAYNEVDNTLWMGCGPEGTATSIVQVNGAGGSVAVETARAEAAEALIAASVTAETTRAEGVEATLATSSALAAETSRAEAAEALLAPLASPALTGVPTAPTAAPGTSTTQLATTAFDTAAVLVETNRATAAEALKAPIASPTFTGVPAGPTAAPGTNTTQLATTAFDTAAVAVETSRATTAEALLAPKASPALTGTPTAPTATAGTNTTQLATTAFDTAAVLVETNRATAAEATKASLASPAFTGTPTAPTATAGTNTTQLATTAFDTAAVAVETARALAAEAALANYTATGTGATTRTIQSRLTSVLQPEDFGAVGNGSTDDTTALQAAVNAAVAASVPLLMTRQYLISSAIGISGAIWISGAGKTVTLVKPTTTNQIAFDVATTAPVTIEKLQINPGSGGATGCTGIFVQPAGSGINTESVFRDLQINFCGTGIDTEQASNWTCDNVSFLNFATGLIVRNTVNVDAGDSAVTNCLFEAPSGGTTQTGILQNSSGGLRLTTNKFLNGQHGYRLNLAIAAVTGDLLIVNNSFESMSADAIRLEQATGGATTALFGDAHIVGNQFNLIPTAVVTLNNLATPGWLNGLVISSNTIKVNGSGTAINLFGCTGVSIDANNFLALGTGVTCIALDAAGSCSDVVIGSANNRLGSGSAISAYVTNVAANPNTVVSPKMQSGTGSVTVSNASGNVFDTSATAVTFPWAFLGNTPVVIVTPTTAGSVAGAAISGYAISASLTGFTPRIVSSATSNTVPFAWIAYGDW